MYLPDIVQNKKVLYSLEVFPPKKSTSIETIYHTLDGVQNLPVDFISVTYGAGGSNQQKRKTWEIAALLQSQHHIPSMAHLTCLNSDREEMTMILEKLKSHRVRNILALRGDPNPDVTPKEDFRYACDLVRFIRDYDDSFAICGACYPEGHSEAPSRADDLRRLKEKVDAGVGHLITQLFFDNDMFYRFYDKALQMGIDVPIQAGIMPLVNKAQVERTVAMCGASVPRQLAKMISRYADDPEALYDAGIAYATQQIVDLLANDVRGIHLYAMNRVEVATKITNSIQHILQVHNKG